MAEQTGPEPELFAADNLRKVDARRLAALGQRVTLALDIGCFDRLQDALGSSEHTAVIALELTFGRDQQRRITVHGRCSVALPLTCMTCLRRRDQSLRRAFDVCLMTPAAVEALEPSERLEVDIVETDPTALDLLALVEDELLLSLPERLCSDESCPYRPGFSYGPVKVSSAGQGATAVHDNITRRPFSNLKTLLRDQD